MIKELVKVATKLDSLGLTKKADFLDKMIEKIANDWDDYGFDDEPTEAVDSPESNPEHISPDYSDPLDGSYFIYPSDVEIDGGTTWDVVDSDDYEVGFGFKTKDEAEAFIAGLEKAKTLA